MKSSIRSGRLTARFQRVGTTRANPVLKRRSWNISSRFGMTRLRTTFAGCEKRKSERETSNHARTIRSHDRTQLFQRASTARLQGEVREPARSQLPCRNLRARARAEQHRTVG